MSSCLRSCWLRDGKRPCNGARFTEFHDSSFTTGISVATKRKSKKHRSSGSGIASGVVIGLLLIGGLGGIGFVGYLIYEKVVVPALAEQRAEKVRQEFAAAQGQAGVPAGWKMYSLGQFQMLVPEQNRLAGPTIQRTNGDEIKTIYHGQADGVSIGISTLRLDGMASQFSGRSVFDVMLEKANREKLQASMRRSIVQDRILDGSPRCREFLVNNNGTNELNRWYEDGPTGILVIGMVGDPQLARFQEVVRSMAYAAPVAAPTSSPAATSVNVADQTAAPVDVLALIDPNRHQIAGEWKKRGRDLLSPNMVVAMLELPFQAAPSYEMDLEVERIGAGVESFNIAFPIDRSWGMVVLDGYEGRASGLNLVNRQKALINPDRYQKPVFGPGKNQIKLIVTPTSVVVEVNGTTIVNWTGDANSLSLEDYWLAGTGRPFIGTWNAEYIVSRIVVRGTTSPKANASGARF